eukprot:6899131-Lingulodinium_polyedra.AAC.1
MLFIRTPTCASIWPTRPPRNTRALCKSSYYISDVCNAGQIAHVPDTPRHRKYTLHSDARSSWF